jgi:hypothetical protein
MTAPTWPAAVFVCKFFDNMLAKRDTNCTGSTWRHSLLSFHVCHSSVAPET